PSLAAYWLPTGFAFAAVILAGYRMLPAIFVASLAASALSSGMSYAAVGIAAANTLEACAAGFLLDGWAEGRNTFSTTTGIGRFVPIAMGAAAVGAGIGAGSDLLFPASLAGETAGWSTFAATWLAGWLRDLTAGVVITPVLILWVTERPRSFEFASFMESLVTIAAAAAIGILVFGPRTADMPYRSALGI